MALLASLALSALALLFGLLEAGGGTAQELVMLGADTNATGNTATSLGPHEDCRSVAAGETFPLDIFVSVVQDLVHWELYVKFEPSIIEVTDADPYMFLANNPRSQPDGAVNSPVRRPVLPRRRRYARRPGVRLRRPGTATMKAKSSGFSPLNIPSIDTDLDGRIDLGPRLTATEATPSATSPATACSMAPLSTRSSQSTATARTLPCQPLRCRPPPRRALVEAPPRQHGDRR